MYTTLAEVKTFLWISTTSEDTRITAILGGVEAFVYNIIWDINTGDKTEEINLNIIEEDLETIPLSNYRVTKIKTVNGTDFTSKVDGTDYKIRNNDKVTIKWLCDYLSDLEFNVFDIVYTSWLSEIPEDLKNAIANLVWYELAKVSWKNVVSETTWPRQIRFSDSENQDVVVVNALNIIKAYQVLNLKYFT